MNRVSLILVACLGLLVGGCGETRTSAEHVVEAEALLAREDFRPAVIELKNALQKDPGNRQARLLLGKASFATGELASAEKELRHALELGSPAAEVYPTYAQVLLALERHAPLGQLQVEGLDAEARSTVRAAQALSLLRQGETDAVITAIDQVLDSPPVSPYALVAGAQISLTRDNTGEEARYLLDQALDKDADYAPAWSLRGDVAIQLGDLAEAEEDYSKAIAGSHNLFNLHYKRGLVRVSAQRFDAAEEDLKAIKKLVSSHPGMDFLEGMVLLGRNELGSAKQFFDKAAVAPEQYPLALYYLAAIHRADGNLVMALSNVDRFLTILPDNSPARKLAATIEYQLGNHARIPALLQPVIATDPADVYALNLLANSLIASGETERGTALLQRVAEQEPESAEALTRLGAGLLATGQQELGMENLQAALRLEPRYERAEQALVTGHLQQGNVDAALAQAENYVASRPNDAEALKLKGRVHLAAGDIEQARTQFLAALQIEPGDPEASLALANLALQAGDLVAARTYYDGVLELDPQHLEALVSLAALEALENREPAMVEILQRAMAAHPAALQPRLILARYYLLKRQSDKVVTVLGELPQLQRNRPPVMAVLAEAELNQQHYAAALPILERLVRQQPGDARVHLLLARAQSGLKDVSSGIESLERAVALSPDFILARLGLARLYLLTGRHEQLQEQVAKLTELAPDNTDVLKLQASVANLRGDRQQALSKIERVFAKSPSRGSMLELAMQRRATDDETGAITLLRDWVAEHPADVPARIALAEFLSAAGQGEESIEAYGEVLEVDADNVVALNNLAWQFRDSEPKKALEYIQRAVAASPEAPSPNVLDTQAIIYLKIGDLRRARRSIDDALSAAPGHPAIRFSSAQISVAEGDRRTAVRELTSLLEGDKEFPEKAAAQQLLAELQQGG
ncbi:PEP-CTERM system TPR-repeat protein PrsT [Haliea sp. E1-2-M8]|uniref:XrtA/PEP-CTERM system TPR-repeat protein PrsT n=1 Tax=Haliea sp. E1-2-M8 TaxID=3064706 RepID=UPI00271583AD|nr:XrtA/PEP-CTERM system TPR-repeat protein PrsT [Haliea sp. E1-2-M8]MDO8863751.1 PEP-CTERM system TPR-repeat protein PrsT [Haliea sp. E1-2-M8]